jgi:hypothetical protein
MNRRSFASLLVASPLVVRLPGAIDLTPRAERRFLPASTLDAFGSIDVEVMLAVSERQARGLRNQEAHDPFDGLVGEFYISDSHPVDIADDLPGSVTTYETIVGVAAQKGTVHVGGFRRGKFVWTIRVIGPVDRALEAAEAISRTELPDEIDVRFAPSLLNGLLPEVDDFSVEVRVAAEEE